MNGNNALFETDRSMVDIYTVAHLGFGYIARRYGWSSESILILATLYELIEDRLIADLGMHRVGWSAEPKSNALMDVASTYIGVQLAER